MYSLEVAATHIDTVQFSQGRCMFYTMVEYAIYLYAVVCSEWEPSIINEFVNQKQ
jgi:hypothetical protein